MDALVVFTVCCLAYILSAIILVVGAGIRRVQKRSQRGDA